MGCVTGKPVSQGGVRGRNEATGLGVYYGVREFLGYSEVQESTGLNGKIAGSRIIIQGFGNVGYWAAKFFEQHGAKVIAISEYESAVVNEQGLNIQSLLEYRKSTGSFIGYTGAKVIEKNPSQVMEMDCDILIPAALEQQITRENCHRIKAKLIGEGANGPLTPFAHEHLTKRGVVVIPDMLLNAGGVTVSYFEWLKNLSHVRFGRMNKRWDERGRSSFLQILEDRLGRQLNENERKSLTSGADETDLVYSGLEDTMIQACLETRNTAREQRVDHRTAAFMNAIRKIASAHLGSGIMFMK